MIPIVLHMRNGDSVAHDATAGDLKLIADTMAKGILAGTITIDDGAAGQRMINLAAIDWVEIKAADAEEQAHG